MNFYERVIKTHPRFHSRSRVNDLALLEPTFRAKVEQIIIEARAEGIDLMVFETYRSPELQETYFKQGATKLRKVGVHHYGLACDLVKSANGQPSWKGSFDFLGKLARKHGLVWGGDWKGFVDAVHVQAIPVSRQAELFNGTWYPEPDEEIPINAAREESEEPDETTTAKVIVTTKTEGPNETVEKQSIISTVASNPTVKEIASAGVSKMGNRVATGLATGSATSVIGGFLERNLGLIIFGCVLIVLACVIIALVIWHRSSQQRKAAEINSDRDRDDVRFMK